MKKKFKKKDRLRDTYRLCTTLIEKSASDDVQESLKGLLGSFVNHLSFVRRRVHHPSESIKYVGYSFSVYKIVNTYQAPKKSMFLTYL